MTVPSTARRAGPFTGTGAAVNYPFTFKVFAKEDLEVTIANLSGVETVGVLDSDYSVFVNVNQDTSPGGYVRYAVGAVDTALPTGYALAVTGFGLEFGQPADISSGGNFDPVVIENALDNLEMQVQNLLARADRSFTLPETAPGGISTVLPTPVASTLLGWNADGTALVNYAPVAGSATALQIQLAVPNAPTGGAGMIGYRPNVVYTVDTVGYALQHGSGSWAAPTSMGFGNGAGLAFTAAGTANTAGGYLSQNATTLGVGNTSFGYQSLTVNVSGNYSTAVGGNNQHFATGAGLNSTFGYGCGYNITVGTSNTAAGFEALHDCRAGSANTVFGYAAQHYGLANGGVADTNNVTAVGTYALQNNRASNTVAVGFSALKDNQGAGNTGVGYNVAVSNTTGSQSTYLGESAGANKTVGTYDTMIGFQAGQSQTTSLGFNTYVGGLAGFYNTTALQNVFVGYSAGQGTSGQNGGGGNVAIGNQAMQLCGSVSGNVAIGNTALRRVTGVGANNIAIGNSVATQVTTGIGNTIVGDSAFAIATTANSNTAVGKDSLNNMTGDSNTALGHTAGTPAASQSWTNTTSIGFQALPTGSNQITLGNASIATIRAQVTTITALSDSRDKANQRTFGFGLDLINSVEIVAWDWDQRAGSARNGTPDFGVIAQQLLDVQTRHGAHWLGLVDTSNPDRLEATPGKLLFPLIVAVQELSQQVAELRRAA